MTMTMMLLMMMMASLHVLLRFMKARNQPLIGQKQCLPQSLRTDMENLCATNISNNFKPLKSNMFSCFLPMFVIGEPPKMVKSPWNEPWNLWIRERPFIVSQPFWCQPSSIRPTSNVAILSPTWWMMPRRPGAWSGGGSFWLLIFESGFKQLKMLKCVGNHGFHWWFHLCLSRKICCFQRWSEGRDWMLNGIEFEVLAERLWQVQVHRLKARGEQMQRVPGRQWTCLVTTSQKCGQWKQLLRNMRNRRLYMDWIITDTR